MQDKFILVKQSLLTTSKPIDLEAATQITGFEIGGVEPSTSKRRIVFQVDNKIYRFEGNNLMQIDCDKTVAEVLVKGNTAAELLQVTDISAWCGKKIYPVIALESLASASVMPTIKLGIKWKSFSDIFQKTELSEILTLGELTKITAIKFTNEVIGGGKASLQARLLQKNLWSDFMTVDEAVGQNASAIQLKGLLSVTSTTGSSTAKISDAEVSYIKNAGEIASKKSAIYFQSEDFDEDLATAYILLKHNYLADNDIKVFVNFDDAPLIKNASLGAATGSLQTFTLDSGIDLDSLELCLDGVKTYDFTLNAANKTLSLTADRGKNITVSYKYNISAEKWLECEKQFTVFDQNSYAGEVAGEFTSRYVYRLETPEKSKVANVKIEVTAENSAVEIYKIGVGFSL